jgi:hypothetical protein
MMLMLIILTADLFKEGYNGLSKSYFIISDDGKGMSGSDILING